ncbi:hypothetical protein SRHO_G00286270 [Serrasalmus rhombeus]
MEIQPVYRINDGDIRKGTDNSHRSRTEINISNRADWTENPIKVWSRVIQIVLVQDSSWTRDHPFRPAQYSSVRRSHSQHCKLRTRMKLSVLLFLSALALSSGSRCTGSGNLNGYNDFKTKHILKEKFNFDSKEAWKSYLERTKFSNKMLCGRESLQTFFERSREPEVKKICNGQGFEQNGGKGNLCVSKQTFPVHKIKSEKTSNECIIKEITPVTKYVIVGCDKVSKQCLPVHFETQTSTAPNNSAPVCQP